jgi:UDP-N-acetylmuramoyl-tripeptide--D-alanyl-D-alanine ligase
MIRYYWTRYLGIYPTALLYMLQDTEFNLPEYIKWFCRTSDFRHVMKRRELKLTQKIKLLRIGLLLLWFLGEIVAAVCIYEGLVTHATWWAFAALFIILILPFVLAYGILLPLVIGRLVIQRPREKAIIAEAHAIFARHQGVHIAIVGSFGKTTAKEILNTVLSAGLKVAATPGNMNTPIGISRFARTLTGNEDVLIIEFGEGKVGDIAELSKLAQPNTGIITGINESHLKSFKSIDNTISTIYELVAYVGKKAIIYKNKENDILHTTIDKKDIHAYSQTGVNGWKVTNLTTGLDGTQFTIKKADTVIQAHTKLIGLHTVGVTAAAISIADSLGLTKRQIETGLADIKPFEHRMDPRNVHGAWVIDDTYNGSSDGVKAGLTLLKDAKAKRRIYVTPGLVEQGSSTESVHIAIGEQAATSADIVVLMKNSATDYILKGLETADFKGELMIIDDPLDFYGNLEHFVAAGDVVLMQNDWTDNYV